MTEQLQKQVMAALKVTEKDPPASSPKKLCAYLRGVTRKLRLYYLRASQSPGRATQDEWLCDNYYVLEKESKQSVKDIRHLAKTAAPGELVDFYRLLRRVLTGVMPPICDESLTVVLRAISAKGPISEKQFSFLPAAIKTILVEMSYEACLEAHSPQMIGYAVIGLGKLGAVDMEGIIHDCSRVEEVLMEDPAGVYPRMDSDSRQYYRHLVARIAHKTKTAEQRVAQDLLEQCRSLPEGDPRRHIGRPLIHSAHIRDPRRRRGRLALSLGILIPLLVSGLLGFACRSLWLVCVTYLPVWEICRTIIQHIAMAGAAVDFIPRMDFKKLGDKPKTVVLVSTLLPKPADAPQLGQRLEQLYFSNSDPDMYYCLLADFGESPFPTDEKDESQIAAARRVLQSLNREHGDRFMLFLRARTFNKTQQRYCGWERKRGAITEFVRYVKGEKVSLHTFIGDSRVLPDIRYIIALDADTNLLYESAQTLVAAAIHPLNRPVVSPEGVVTEGYGILTPKISADLESARRTAFSRVITGCGGVTAYDTKDKDFYQDLFGESIFAGKGLIDLDCFYEVLGDRFPENRILSHDILEGAYLRVGFVSDAGMTDGTPQSMISWLSRLHRWMRGDWQNLPFIAGQYRADGKVYQNPISTLSKYKLFDNLRRSLTSITALLCLVAALFTPGPDSLVLLWSGLLATAFSSLWAAVWSMVTGGFFTLSRKFFTRTLPHTFELIAQGLFFLIMLPAQALVTADAVCRALWRLFVSRKRLLEWVTAAQGDVRGVTPGAALRRFWLPELIGVAYLLLAFPSAAFLAGILFVVVAPVAYYSAKASPEDKHTLSSAQRDTLIGYNAAMWRYYETFAGKENHYLPPDNIQQSPVFRVAARTSPTNIGMMLLSTLAARDMDLIDTAGLYLRVERTISTVEKLETWNGNLINWYDTVTLDTLKPEFVSTVDSGNFICCLVALAQGLREFLPENRQFGELIERIEAIVDATNWGVLYNEKKRLFSIGYDLDKGELSQSHYDFLMSEARLTSYYAVAKKTVDKKHWGTLNRTMSRCGSYAGAVSWTGTMFEYFMPHLLLPVYEGSLLGEALLYCLYCQKRRVRGLSVPWGISESAFFAFDNNLNYQYKAHGVQKIGVKRYLDEDLVISPYSTFLTIPMNPNSSMENLGELRELGVYGRYGFYEAVDFTARRVGAGALAVTRSYMAHHIGMSMVSSCNALFENRMQKRFMRDNTMKSAKEFLQEKITKNTVVFDSLHQSGPKGEKNNERPRLVRSDSHVINPQAPRCTLLTNGEITDILTDTGAGYLKFGDVDLTRRSTDLLRRAQGLMALVRIDGKTIPATLAPFYDPDTRYSVEYQEQSVTYFARQGEIEVGMRCMLHPTISCEQRQVVVKNTSPKKQTAQVLLYFEPILCQHTDWDAHPAYSKLFVEAAYDKESKTITYSRRKQDSSVDMYLTVGFLQDLDFSFETRREMLQTAPEGLWGLKDFHDKSFSKNGGGVPDACCALKFDLPVAGGGQAQATLLVCASRSVAEGVQGIISMRKIGVLESRQAAKSPLLGDSLEGRLGCAILGMLLFRRAETPGAAPPPGSRLGQSALWSIGISGDLPIALLELEEGQDNQVLRAYLRLHRTLHNLKVEFDLCIVWKGADSVEEEILELIGLNSVRGIVGSRGGVFVLRGAHLPPEILGLLRTVARHTASGTLPDPAPAALPPFQPVRPKPTLPDPLPSDPELTVQGGVFLGGRFYVNRLSPLPYSHVLSNGAFGTLLSDRALGYTWAINARENKLTPWYNDICTDNTGEMLLLWDGEHTFDLINGSRASFHRENARYCGKAGKIHASVEVTVSGSGCAKYIDVCLKNLNSRPRSLKCAYYTEPVLGVDRSTAEHILPSLAGDGDALVLENPYNTAVPCCAALTARSGEEKPLFTTRRAAFLSGDWQAVGCEANGDPCAAVILPLRLRPDEEIRLRFTLSYGRTPDAALKMAALSPPPKPSGENRIRVATPDEALNQYINHFAPHQVLASRIRGRTAFYQCGGAYGFRDQLQDCCAWLLLEPVLTRRQILRCCAVQFEEGDVLHWWHPLPASGGGLKGVRTRFSDDLLWLPYAVSEYIVKTGDKSILDTSVAYLSAPVLKTGEHEKYISPEKSDLKEDVYHHCLRALDRGYNLDERGLPLIGCGDWNDGFSAVGLEGKGSSVWLAMFLSVVLDSFSAVCRLRGDEGRAEQCLERAAGLRQAVDAHCWDGEWYIRAFFDNGEKMGSHSSAECGIDLLPQSFAVFSGMPDRQRVEQGLDNAWQKLVDPKLQIVRLFTPPFQYGEQNPGYVKAYPVGIRENGGQYTHAAVWFAMALLQFGKVEEGFGVLEMLNPVHRCQNPALARQYMLEPYYMPADIYANPHVPGRGGWSMYTGAAAWYYRAVLEQLLGLRMEGDRVRFAPMLPESWEEADLDLVLHNTTLRVEMRRGISGMLCDQAPVQWVHLDGGEHQITVGI